MDIKSIKANYEFLDLLIVDLFGKLRHVSLPASYLSEETLERGVGFDASNTMFATLSQSDLVIVPDVSASFESPFTKYKTLLSFGHISGFKEMGNLTPFQLDPRLILKKSISILKDSGIADELMVLPELEFFVFDNISYSLNPLNSYYSIFSSESEVQNGRAYHLIPPYDKLMDLRSKIVRILEDIDVNVKYHHHEVGIPAQCEIELNFEEALKAADDIEIAKYIIKNCAASCDMTATFMPKPIYGTPGSGMHMHLYLVDGNKESIFYDSSNDLHLSKTALHFIGGILLHLSSLMALTNPSLNSYKRLVPGFEAPTGKSFGKSDRTSSIRIPGYTKLKATRIEFRTPDATCNPYYAISAILLAGIDGIKKEIDPFNDEAINISASIPKTLDEALEALKADNSYLTDVFGKEFPSIWTDYKLKEEERCKLFPTPAEVATYFDY